MTDFLSQEFLQSELNKFENKDQEIDFSKYENDPKSFFDEILQIKTYPKQLEIANSLLENKKTSVRSANKTGKTFISAAIALWWARCRPKAKAVLTSPTHRQIKDLLYKEIKSLYVKTYRENNIQLGGTFNIAPQTGLQYDDGSYIVGFATDLEEKFQGYSGPNLLFVVDEASGVPDHIYHAIRGNLPGKDNALLAIGNPNIPYGWFYDSFQGPGSWNNIHLSAFDAAPYADKIPGLHDYDSIDSLYLEEGDKSPQYQIRVLGDFPSYGQSQLFSLDMIQSSNANWEQSSNANSDKNNNMLRVGIDVSRTVEGDPTIIQFVRGNYAYEPISIPGSDGKGLAQAIENIINNYARDNEFVVVNIDSIGIGASPVDFLREKKIKINDINVGMNANDEQYYNLRTEAYMKMRKWIEDGGMIPPDENLKKELLAHSYIIDERGRIRLEKKDKVKLKLSGKSPDRSDALSLALLDNIKRKNNNIRYISMGKTKTSNLKKSGL